MKGNKKIYASINGRYIECTDTVQELIDKISKLEYALNKIASMPEPYDGREAFTFASESKEIAKNALL